MFPTVFCVLIAASWQCAYCLRLTVEPSNIDPGLTEKLLLNCTLTSTKLSGFIALKNLTLLKSVDESRYIELCSIRFDAGYQDLHTGDGTGDGVINNKGTSFLSLQWLFPNHHMSGEYKCEADGISLSWKQITLTSTATVSGSELSMSSLSETLRSIQIENFHKNMNNDHLQNSLAEINTTVSSVIKNASSMANYIENQIIDIKVLQENQMKQTNSTAEIKVYMKDLHDALKIQAVYLEKFKLDLILSVENFFYRSELFDGHRYYLTKQLISFTPQSAEATCELYGGYLAEIDSDNELNFVRAFISQFISNRRVRISGTDEDVENIWVSSRNKKHLKFLKWFGIEPDGGRDQNCIVLDKEYNWGMGSVGCLGINTSYICEIQEH